MTLAELVRALGQHDLVIVAPDVALPLTGVSADSRTVSKGELFIAARGSVADGHRYITAALTAGAVAVVSEQPAEIAVPVVVVRDGRRAAQVIAKTWYGAPARALELVAVTGTNGKTTTTAMVRHLLNANHDAGSIGTLGAFDASGARVE